MTDPREVRMTTTDREVAVLTKAQRAHLSRYECAWCDIPLSSMRCGTYFGPCCSPMDMVNKRAACLAGVSVTEFLASQERDAKL